MAIWSLLDISLKVTILLKIQIFSSVQWATPNLPIIHKYGKQQIIDNNAKFSKVHYASTFYYIHFFISMLMFIWSESLYGQMKDPYESSLGEILDIIFEND